MNTSEPKDYINVLQGDGKNFALASGDRAYWLTCNVIPNVLTNTKFASKVGNTKYSKVHCYL